MNETLKETIERLKKNEQGWAFLSENDRQCLKTVHEQNKVDYLTGAGAWVNTAGTLFDNLGANEIYRISPDYQPERPEPEYIDLPIEIDGPWLGVRGKISLIPYGFCHLHCIPSLPGFEGFRLAEEEEGHEHDIPLEGVSRCYRQGKVVVARFEKERL